MTKQSKISATKIVSSIYSAWQKFEIKVELWKFLKNHTSAKSVQSLTKNMDSYVKSQYIEGTLLYSIVGHADEYADLKNITWNRKNIKQIMSTNNN